MFVFHEEGGIRLRRYVISRQFHLMSLQIPIGLIRRRYVIAMDHLCSMETVKDSSMAILFFVCLLNYLISIRFSIMTNNLVILKRNENRPILLLLILVLLLF